MFRRWRSRIKRYQKKWFFRGDLQNRFSRIYRTGYWLNSMNPGESRSGHGSTMVSTEQLRANLAAFLREQRASSLFDAPCGDFNWMPHVLTDVRKSASEFQYLGGDIVKHVIAELQPRTDSSTRFMVFDITRDRFPQADIWLCRDCLQHLSFSDIWRALEHFSRSPIEFALLSNHHSVARNTDILSGDFRFVDLTLPPFNLPPPARRLGDVPVDAEPRYIGVWRRAEIAEALARRST